MCAARLLRVSAANIGPNRFHQNRTVSWLMSIPRSARRSSTRSDSGYLTYIITTRRMTWSRRGGGWNWVGVVSGLLNPNDSRVGALEWRPRHDEGYHEGCGCRARTFAL